MKLAAKGYTLRQRVRQKLCPKIVDDDRDTFLRGIRPCKLFSLLGVVMDTAYFVALPFLYTVVILGQMFGIFPIYGVTRNDPERFRLKWFSLRVILNLTVVVTALLQAYYEYGRLKAIGINAKNVSSLIFFIDACLINVLFLNLATKWRSVAMKWDEVDDTFNRPPYHMQGWSLRKRLGVVSFTLVFLAAGKWINNSVSIGIVFELSLPFDLLQSNIYCRL